METGQKLTRSAILGQLPIIVQLLSGFILMPKMINFFGDRHYGLWVLIGTFLGYFGLLDLGFSNTIVRYVSRALGRNDNEESNGWITIGLFFFLISSVIGFVFLFLAVWSCKYFVSEDLDLIRKVFLVGGSAFLIALPSKCSVGILQAHVRGDVIKSVTSIVGILRIATLLAALFVKASFILFIYILVFFTILEGIIVTVLAFRIHGNFQIYRGWITRGNLKTFVDYSGFSLIAQFADLLRFQTYPLIISAFLGLSAVTPFAIANRIRMILGSIHNNFLINLTPVFSQIEGRSNVDEKLKHAYLFSYKISSYFVLFTGGVTAVLAPSFIVRWMGPNHNDSIVLLLVSLVGSLAAGIQIPAVCFLFGTSKHRFYSISNSIEAGLIILTALLLVKPFGLFGMVVGASASTFCVKMFLQPLWVSRALKIPFYDLHLKHTIPNMLKVGVFILLCWFGAEKWVKPTYLSIASLGALASVAFAPYIFLIGFTALERRQLYASMPVLGRSEIIRKTFERIL